jgi:hypothetical protein
MLDVSAIRGSDSDKVRLPVVVFVLWFIGAIALCVQGIAFAEEVSQQPDDEKFRWHVRAGLQVAHQNPDFRYVPDKPTGVTAWNSNRDIPLTSFSFFALQRELTDDSSVELSYISDGSWGDLYGSAPQKMSVCIPFLFRRRCNEITIYPVYRFPLEIDVRTYKLTFSRTLWKPEPVSLGASVSIQALQLSMSAKLSSLFESLIGYDHFEYLVVAPSLGVFAEYRPKGPLMYRVSSGWVSVPLGDIEGKLINVNAQAEYRLTDRFFLGFGYRFSDMNIHLHQKRYDLKGSYEVHGYQLYSGFNF